MGIKIDQARQRAKELLSECGIERVPTPLARLARKLGIRVDYTPLDDALSGMAFIKDGQKLVWVNSLHHPNRQRFTLAHEIGHHVLHANELEAGVHVDKGMLRRDAVSTQGTELIEIQANNFASELLMPEERLRTLVGEGVNLEDEARMAALAAKFQVSTAALQYRLLR
ncbi:ImmA/IrrE family metallo-endopeptidase [Maricaulis virginensis]|uniref:ImmA/IrrE family metallo-endopeptidase n=1 Tax=Maricaulis virginensis TaxID=144022 RepID=A0A9W6MPQ9_9PROT|nr:ImmA/IrrE family metallo-endopeptidase [Maricaulis virginensis]GLK53427.1 ImmA/IrrE family metallo-endopeptidase [Maricaulis virginensis]